MIFQKKWGFLVSIFVLLFLILHIPKVAEAQFEGQLGAIGGSVHWGSPYQYQSTQLSGNRIRTDLLGLTTGFTKTHYGTNLNVGNLPPDTYTVTVTARPDRGPAINIGTQTVEVLPGQTTGVDFEMSEVTGLVIGDLRINGVITYGYVQFCGPLETDPCPIDYTQGNNRTWFFNEEQGIKAPMLPGDYRVRVTTIDKVNIGMLPIKVEVGNIVNMKTSSVGVPTGQNVTVSLPGVEVTFSEVTVSGFMTLTTTSHPQGGNPPSQYRFLGSYYELTTTATYIGPITVKFTYDDADVRGREENLKLFHWDGVDWLNITVSVDTENNIITGVTDSLSPFAIGDLLNSPPTVDAGGPYYVDEGEEVVVTASGEDPEEGSLTYAWDLDNDGIFETEGQSVTFSAAGLDGPTIANITVQVTDEGGLTATAEATVEVANVAPIIGVITAPMDPVATTSDVNASVDFTDPGILDTHTAVWDWGDNTISVGTVTGGNATGNHAYTLPGVYTVKVTVTDDDGGSTEQSYQFVVVYDPGGGFVTGGGWINSPSGAYVANPDLTGKANFGFVSKYQQGANVPTGETKFQFKVADLNFDSTEYQWLVVAGPNAKYKGSGTINGEGDYGFMLTSVDGQVSGGGGVDKFRIKIWDKATDTVIYDNQLGDGDDANATMAIGAGSIVIHQ